MSDVQSPYMTVREVAGMLCVSNALVYLMAKRGVLQSLRVEGAWRFLRSSVDSYIRTRMYVPTEEDRAAAHPNGKRREKTGRSRGRPRKK